MGESNTVDRSIKILTIDDDLTSRKLLRSSLKSLGYKNIEQGSNGEEGREMILSFEPDLVFCDWKMPDVEGIELLREVRSDEQKKTLPFVMVTGVTEQEKVVEAMKEGVSAYVAKPFSPSQINDCIRQVFNKK